jgi:arginase family enzyme
LDHTNREAVETWKDCDGYSPILDAKNEMQLLEVINIDAHLDVRPLKERKTYSGSPLRQHLENGEEYILD